MSTEAELNYETFKKQNKILAETNRKLLLTIIKNSPREVVIKVCKELKIIKEEHCPSTNKLELMER